MLPLAILAAWVAWIVTTGLWRLTGLLSGFDPDGLVYRVFTEVTASLVVGGVFVATGTFVAPTHRTESH